MFQIARHVGVLAVEGAAANHLIQLQVALAALLLFGHPALLELFLFAPFGRAAGFPCALQIGSRLFGSPGGARSVLLFGALDCPRLFPAGAGLAAPAGRTRLVFNQPRLFQGVLKRSHNQTLRFSQSAMLISSTSKISVELGPIGPGRPCSP